MHYNVASKALMASCMAAIGATALPASSSGLQSKSITANYDNIIVQNPTAPTQEVGTYKDLTYNSFSVVQQVLEGEGLNPHTQPNVIVFSVVGELTDGSHYITPAPGVDHFDLNQLYFGCTLLSVESAINVPQACTMTFKAYDASGDQTGTASAQYGGGPDMVQVNFGKDFAKVHKVEYEISGGLVAGVTTVGVVDSQSYKVYGENLS